MTKRKISATGLALREFRKVKHIAAYRHDCYERLAGKYGIKASTIRAAASRAGLTSKEDSLKRIFSKKEESTLVEVCRRQARLYKPFTVPAFMKVARSFAGFNCETHFCTRKFCQGFCSTTPASS